MKSPMRAQLWTCAVLLVAAALWQMPAQADVEADDVGAQQKPPERCVPRHLYAQPECWRNLP
jgi:hypothetical protein